LKERNGEADISTEQTRAQAAARVPGPDGDRRRSPDHRGASGARPQEIVRLSLIRFLAENHAPKTTGRRFLSDSPPPAAPHRLKRRADFLRVAAGKRFHGKAFTLQAVASRGSAEPTGLGDQGESGHAFGPPRFGFTVTKKIGNAVVRNRIRRRLKEALRTLDPLPARVGHDYVMIARVEALGLAFTALQTEIVRALRKIDAGKTRAENPPRKSQRDAAPENQAP
jgi:ribonuclease P protein component